VLLVELALVFCSQHEFETELVKHCYCW